VQSPEQDRFTSASFNGSNNPQCQRLAPLYSGAPHLMSLSVDVMQLFLQLIDVQVHCDPAQSTSAAPLTARRLPTTEYASSLRDLFDQAGSWMYEVLAFPMAG